MAQYKWLKNFPSVKFIVVNSGVENGKNLASIDTDIQDWEFLGGFVTAKLSKTGVIGWVGGQCFPCDGREPARRRARR